MALSSESVAAWSGIELVERLTGGARNEVVLARRGGRRVVVRQSGRSLPALEWELDLLDHLASHGIGVPRPIVTDDGRRHVDGVHVHEFIDGRQPRDRRDWRRVIDVLTTVHELTTGWPQRPGFASSRQLLSADRGGDVRLDAMPPEAVRAVRTAWQPVLTGPECVVHGDVNAGNVLVDGAHVSLLDWDEARTDVPWFDFASIPEDVAVPMDRQTLVTAGVAWEAATCWIPEPEYAARRLAELSNRSG
ncbi:phosphotransferase enzyme family protein [Couchioplanes caeruleus]|uniref:phosphotransferase enzyme family protein n=1 Tax=Couchioplanes caeruleus TaxID=56438 RepID=UPI001472CC95|nr:phosphotransferase [Couchioplanes caeruleus]